MSELQIITDSSSLEAQERALIDVQVATAKRFPRQLSQVKKDMLSFATLDEETAESCFYTLPRGGKNIQGPSVRLAEIAVSCYGNLRAGSRVISTVTHGDQPHVVIQSVCHDLEKNVAVTIEKRRRITKKKGKEFVDEDDVNLAVNAGSAIAFRDAVFKVVPGALIKPVYEQAKAVAIGDAKSLGDRRARAIDSFGKMGISKERILEKLEKTNIEDIGVADLEVLFGLHTAIKDGMASLDEAFPIASKQIIVEPPKQKIEEDPFKKLEALVAAEKWTTKKLVTTINASKIAPENWDGDPYNLPQKVLSDIVSKWKSFSGFGNTLGN